MRTSSIKKLLRESGIGVLPIAGILNINSRNIEIYIPENPEGTADLASQVVEACKSKYKLGGFSTGYGSWILSDDYQDSGDWNDRSSRHHY